MSAYILSVCGAVIISALVAIIIPEGKLGKFINGILKIFCVFIMLVPLVRWVSDLRWEPDKNENKNISLDTEYIDYVFGKRAENLSEDICTVVEKEFSVEASVVTDWECADYAFSVVKVHINIKNFGMNENDEHIMIIEQIVMRASEMVGIDREDVEVNEG